MPGVGFDQDRGSREYEFSATVGTLVFRDCLTSNGIWSAKLICQTRDGNDLIMLPSACLIHSTAMDGDEALRLYEISHASDFQPQIVEPPT